MTDADTSPSAWWEARRRRYNIGLVVAGFLAFILYAFAIQSLPQRDPSLDPSEVEITIFHVLFWGIGYLIAMAIANLFYFLGPASERIVRPRDVQRWRRACYALGFGFSVALPFVIPVLVLLAR